MKTRNGAASLASRRAGRSAMGLMQIPRRIEYALRAMIHLADRPDGIASGIEIAQREQIPKYFLEKVIRDLMRRGLVRSRRGPGGGYQLGRPAASISFKDIIEAVEGPIVLNVCLEASSVCSLQPTCRMFQVWEHGQQALLSVFSETNLQEIVASVPSGTPLHRLADSDSAAAQPKA